MIIVIFIITIIIILAGIGIIAGIVEIKNPPKKNSTNNQKYQYQDPNKYIEKRIKEYKWENTWSPYNGARSRTKHTNHYESYIHSASWRKRRQRALRLGHYRCALCGSTQSLQVHHLTYAHLGNELDSELMVLCTSCHHKVHAQKRRKNYYMN